MGEHPFEIDAAAQEYAAFLAKFEAKKTTDDCFTPPEVFAAVHRWAVDEYGLRGRRIVRPFHPDGDFVCFDYRPGDVVLDNPPFSILSKIRGFYDQHGIDYFLFAPTLTLLGIRAPTMLVVGVDVEYANGAKINTSFITSLSPEIRIRTAPALRQALMDAQPKREALPKFAYPPNVRNAALLARIAPVDFSVGASESEFIASMDSQRDAGKSVFGGGYLLSDSAAAALQAAKEKAAKEKAAKEKAAKEKAAKEKAAKEKAAVDTIEWQLSERERAIIERLNTGAAIRAAQNLLLFGEASRV